MTSRTARRAALLWSLVGLAVVVGALLSTARTERGEPPPRVDETAPATERMPGLLGAQGGRAPRGRGGEPTEKPKAAGPVSDPTAHRHVVRGRVIDAVTHRPLEGVRVLGMAGTDAVPLRYRAGVEATLTDADGRYELAFALEELPQTLIFTALKRGYRTPHATLEREGEVAIPRTTVLVTEYGQDTLDFALRPGMVVAGVVVDEEGRPISGVEVVLTENDPDSTGYVEFLATGSDGRFLIHDLNPTKSHPQRKGTLDFTQHLHVAARVDDIYALSPSARASLRIVMRSGLSLYGRLLHADGSPAESVLVEAFVDAPNDKRRGAYADSDGRFHLVGLPTGKLVLRALSGERLSAVRREITLLRNERDYGLVLRLEQMPFARSAAREQVLGLEFVKVPAEARAKLGLYEQHALLITAITDEVPEDLRAHVQVGDMLWIVGHTAVTSPRDVARAIVEQVDRTDGYRRKGGHPLLPLCSVGYVIGIRRPELDGTNTQSMSIPRSQVEALRRWLEDNPEPK